jgi:hypothetical protein
LRKRKDRQLNQKFRRPTQALTIKLL